MLNLRYVFVGNSNVASAQKLQIVIAQIAFEVGLQQHVAVGKNDIANALIFKHVDGERVAHVIGTVTYANRIILESVYCVFVFVVARFERHRKHHELRAFVAILDIADYSALVGGDKILNFATRANIYRLAVNAFDLYDVVKLVLACGFRRVFVADKIKIGKAPELLLLFHKTAELFAARGAVGVVVTRTVAVYYIYGVVYVLIPPV